MTEARQTPLPDLLDGVPEKTVLGIRGDEPMFPSYTNIPIGRLAREAAAELRRLHEENESLRQIVQDFPPVEAELREVSDRAHRLETQRDALLEALRAMRVKYGQYACRVCDLADAAIKAVEEGK